MRNGVQVINEKQGEIKRHVWNKVFHRDSHMLVIKHSSY